MNEARLNDERPQLIHGQRWICKQDMIWQGVRWHAGVPYRAEAFRSDKLGPYVKLYHSYGHSPLFVTVPLLSLFRHFKHVGPWPDPE